MINFCVFICLICALMGFVVDKKIYSPLGCYAFLFTLISFGASLLLFDLYEIDKIVYEYIALGVLCFLIGGVIGKFSYCKEVSKYDCDYYNKTIYNTYLLILLLLYFPDLVRTLKVLIQGHNLTYIYSLTIASSQGIETEVTRSGLEEILNSYVLHPLLNLMIPLSLTIFFRKKDKTKLLISVLLLGLRFITSGTRSVLLSFCEYIFLHILFAFEERKFQKFFHLKITYKKYFKVLIIIAIPSMFFMSIVTKERGITNFYESFYYYYSGALGIFNQKLQTHNYKYSLGMLSLMGFINPIVSTLKHIGIKPVSLFNETLDLYHSLQNVPVYISDHWKGNVLVTNIYYFYADGGILGIIIGSIVYGVISEKIFKSLRRKKTIKNLTIFIFFFCQIILTSHARMSTSLMYTALTFVYMILIFEIRGKFKVI